MDGGLGWLADPGLHMLPQAYWFLKCEMSGTKPIARKAWPRMPREKTARGRIREDCVVVGAGSRWRGNNFSDCREVNNRGKNVAKTRGLLDD